VIGVLGEERREDRQVGLDDPAVAGADGLAVAQGDRGEVLARAGVADRRVVLAALEALEQSAVVGGSQPMRRPGSP
jgi:hypothetical protein